MPALDEILTQAELSYLSDQRLGRLATLGPDGAPNVIPVGYRLLNDEGVVEIIGSNLARSQKWRNVLRDARVSFVVDDLATVDPWYPRGVQLRGLAQAVSAGGRDSIRVSPTRVVAWGLPPTPPSSPKGPLPMRAVRFIRYGGPEVLGVVDVPDPRTGAGQVVVRVRAAGLNLGKSKVRSGLLKDMFPATFPSGQGSDLAGVVAEVGPGVTGVAPGDEVIGFVENRSSQAELVVVEAANLTPRPPGVSWDVAGSLFVMGTTAVAALRAVSPEAGQTLLVSGAAGGVGSIVVQLARLRGLTVIGVAAEPDLAWVRTLGAEAVAYGDGVLQRIRDVAAGIDAVVDTAGHGYVAMAVTDLGVRPDKVDTIIDFPAIPQFGVKSDGNAAGTDIRLVAELADLAAGGLDVPIARTFALDDVVDAYRFLESKRGRGKVVLRPTSADDSGDTSG